MGALIPLLTTDIRFRIQLRSFLFLCVNPFLPNSVIADGELRLIDVIVETSAADVQLDADRCDIVCTDLVVLERALGNSVFHGTGIFQLQECRLDVSAANHPCCSTPTIPVPMQVSFQPILFSYNPLSVRPVLIQDSCVSSAFRSLFYYLTVPWGTGKYGRHVIFLNFCVQNFLRCQSAPSDF